MTEEELQSRIEKGFHGEGPDERAYRTVFNALGKEHSYKLPPGFADRVISKMETVQQRANSRDMVWLYIGLASFFIATGVAIALTNFKVNFGVFKFISGYPGLITFGIVFILALQWVDKKLVRPSTGNSVQ